MSNIDYQAFYEFIQKTIAQDPQTSVKQAMDDFVKAGVTVTDGEVALANMSPEQYQDFVTAQIQLEKGTPVH